jgi:arylsulfatase A-like enzyme
MKNIIILLIDALRPKNLSLFGYNKETDKNIKEIAKNNLLFRQHFSTSNATAPALTSILTAQYPINHGIIHQLPYTKQEEMDKVEKVTFWFPNYLKNKGYETICIDWVGFWLKKDFDFYGEKDENQNELTEKQSLFISAKDTIDLAISRIKKSKKPFFLFTHFWDTHFPFPNTAYESNGTKEDKDKMLASIQNESQKEYLRKRIQNTNLYTIQDMVDKYDLAIKDIDYEIGRLYNFLKEQNLWEDTIFFVLGDHGDNLTSHDIYFSHAGLYDDSIHVPMIIHLPGLGKQEINKFSQHVDIIPTILDYLKFDINTNFDGTSLLPLIKNNITVREKIFAFDGLCNDIKAVRTKNRKLIIAKDNFCNLCKASHHEPIEEYDLENDPEETKNIYSKKSELMKFLD